MLPYISTIALEQNHERSLFEAPTVGDDVHTLGQTSHKTADDGYPEADKRLASICNYL